MNGFIRLILATSFLSIHPSLHSLEQTSAVTVANVLNTGSSWDGKPLAYPAGPSEVTGLLVNIAPGGETGWHLHPVPSFAMVIEGVLEIQLKNGDKKQVKAGEAFAEVVNTLHNGRNIGDVPVKLIVFYAGIKDQTLSVKEVKP